MSNQTARPAKPRSRSRLRWRPRLEALESRNLLSTASSVLDGSFVLEWNAIALEAIRLQKTSPPVAARDLAVLQIAIDDAVHVAARTPIYQPGARDTLTRAAVAFAANRTLDALFPAEAPFFDRYTLHALPAGGAELRGMVIGDHAASAILAKRANDGSQLVVPYQPGSAPGQWRPTLPTFAPALLPGWGHVTPFVGPAVSKLHPPPPPSLTSRAYAQALQQVEQVGSVHSTVRTADQTQIAEFWSDGAGTATPPGHWNEIAAALVTTRHLSLQRTADLFATLDAALADAGIACWNCKYTDNQWRPITAIREAGTAGIPGITADSTWTPLLATPAFPSYVSGHSTFSGAAATVLSAYFGPQTAFTTTSDGLPGVTRSFRSFDQAASEAGMSRIYGGIHFAFDNTAGLTLGRSIGQLAVCRAVHGGF
jgi:hypothetical protein